MRTNQTLKIKHRKFRLSGQAMVELAVALVVILALFAGLLQVGRLTIARTNTMITAREQAGQAAMLESHYGTRSAMYILNWSMGPDGKAYTADDVPFPVTNASDTMLEITSAARPDDLAAFVPENPFLDAHLDEDVIAAFFLVHGQARDSVPTFPVVRSLFYNRPTISIGSDAWLVWTRGIY